VSWPVRFLLDDTRLLGRALDVSEEGLCVLTAPTDALKQGRSYHILMVLRAGARPSRARRRCGT